MKRGDLDDAGLAFLGSLSVIDTLELELPQVGQIVADAAGREGRTCVPLDGCRNAVPSDPFAHWLGH
jgi:hypothetical protein